ncbi:hypothetical protein MML48_5g00015218 [Holotrichia oblita]|uniref:Uncharacterized protein n=1 Tax=Holotrichia oblita TaxID=644536 RepID=A0ACB9T4K1_HOLOL|nr:hypothetical protein MML48_5g00015218 [Holotrichia oblita]
MIFRIALLALLSGLAASVLTIRVQQADCLVTNQLVHGSKGVGNRFDEQRLTLRIHRGRGSSSRRQQHGSPHSNGSNSTTTTTGSASPSPRGRHERVKISVSYPSSENLTPSNTGPQLLAVTPTSPTGQASYTVHYSVNGKETTATNLCRRDNHLKVSQKFPHRRHSERSNSCDSSVDKPQHRSPSPSVCDDDVNKPKIISKKMGRRNIKAQYDQDSENKVGVRPYARFGRPNLAQGISIIAKQEAQPRAMS